MLLLPSGLGRPFDASTTRTNPSRQQLVLVFFVDVAEHVTRNFAPLWVSHVRLIVDARVLRPSWLTVSVGHVNSTNDVPIRRLHLR